MPRDVEHAASTCRNCGAELEGRYCHRCGQDSVEPPTKPLGLLGALAAGFVGLESRGLRSFLTLLFRPGELTRAYVDGRRVRYSSPVQVYLWCTAAFFLTHSFLPLVRLDPETGRVVSSLSVLSVRAGLSDATLGRLAAEGTSMLVFAERFDVAVTAYFPTLLLALVVAVAVLLALQYWREPALKHVVFALHWCALYFTLEIVRRPLPDLGNWGITGYALSFAVVLVYMPVAMKVVYGRSLPSTIVRAVVTLYAFGALLGLWLWSATVFAERFA